VTMILMVKAVIFDWDGTLADTKKAVVRSFQKILVEAGCVVSDEFIERRIGIGTKRTLEQALEECNVRFDYEMLENLAIEKIRIQARLGNIVGLFGGAIELLEELPWENQDCFGNNEQPKSCWQVTSGEEN